MGAIPVVLHGEPKRRFEVDDAFGFVGVKGGVGLARDGQGGNSRLFFHFSDGGFFQRFPSFQLAFGKVPFVVAL